MIEKLHEDIRRGITYSDILVVAISPSQYRDQVDYLYGLLNKEEKDKCSRIIKISGREHYIIQRGLLKLLIGFYSKVEPMSIVIKKASNGKPFCESYEVWSFNISNSSDRIVYALSNQYEVGIDLEYTYKMRSFHEIMTLFFSEKEQRSVIHYGCIAKAFYKLWTGKEATLKADGLGLRGNIKALDVSTLLHYNQMEYIFKEESYQIRSFELNGEYVGALAYKRSARGM
ncbi:MAG: 4'-phosphopantetheinyl transferase superfamily protein [Lutisporaceae bacterium]